MSFLTYLINGISLGSIYAIIALGYTMVYGIAKMLNFAHGDFIMVGCYVIFSVSTILGGNSILSIVIAIILCTILGVTTEFIAYRPLRGAASPLAVLITAIGVSYLLENIALLIYGADIKSFSTAMSVAGNYDLATHFFDTGKVKVPSTLLPQLASLVDQQSVEMRPETALSFLKQYVGMDMEGPKDAFGVSYAEHMRQVARQFKRKGVQNESVR